MQPSPTYTITTGPTTEPLTLAAFKDRLRVLSCDFDGELSDLLTAARKQVEYDTRRALITQSVTMYLWDFHGTEYIEIRLAPVSAISSVKYYDQDGTLQTWSSSNYRTELGMTPPRIYLVSDQDWPVTDDDDRNRVQIAMTAGYGAATAVPQNAKLAMVEYAKATWYDCEKSMARYNQIISSLKWGEHYKVWS